MPDKHHYIPIFYLKQWCGPDGKLCEYSKPHREVKVKQKYPQETAFEHDLNRMSAFPPDVADIVERRLMGGIDSNAATALRILLDQRIGDLTATERTSWAVFVISLWRRTPEQMTRLAEGLRAAMVAHNVDLSPVGDGSDKISRAREALFQREFAVLLQNVITSEKVGTHIINMRWSVARFRNTKHTLLTSDRPFVMTNGLAKPDAHIAVPISPTHCFLASNTLQQERVLHSIPPDNFIFQVNDRMAAQARRFVFGINDQQRRFVANRFGRREPSAPGDDYDLR